MLIEDTTDLDYSSHRHCQGLGQVGNEYGRGLCLHSTLALRVEAWDLNHCPDITALGLIGQNAGPDRKAPAGRKKRIGANACSGPANGTVGRSFAAPPPSPPRSHRIYVADRESDLYEAFERCVAQHLDFIIRAQYDRTLAQEDQGLLTTVREAPVLGCFELEVRTRKDRPARTAKLELRSATVTLQGVWRPGGRRPQLQVNVVLARELDVPAQEQPIEWVLLTSLPVQTFVQARRIVARYAKRWTVEEFHKALKSGVQVEKSELETAQRLQALIAVSVVIAVRLLNTKLLARAHPDQPVESQTFGPEALEILSARYGEPLGGWKYASLFLAIARLGGFLARRRDGDPRMDHDLARLAALDENDRGCAHARAQAPHYQQGIWVMTRR